MAQDLVMRIIMAASDKASSAFERVKRASSGLSGKLVELEKELTGLERAQKLIVKRNQLDEDMKKNSLAIANNRKEMQALREEIARTGPASRMQIANLAALRKESEKLKNAQSKNGAELEELMHD